MSAAGTNALLTGRRVAFDTLRNLFFESDVTVDFLKPNAAGDDFDVIAFIESSWWLRYDAFRERFQLEVVGVNEGDITVPVSLTWMQTILAEATHLQIAEDIYLIAKRDVLAPKGTSVTWKIFCTRLTKRSQHGPLY